MCKESHKGNLDIYLLVVEVTPIIFITFVVKFVLNLPFFILLYVVNIISITFIITT